jgi:signal transduction histidine kinase
MGRLAAGVAHEVRNPLNGIGLIVQQLARRFTPVADQEKYREYVDTVARELARLNDIVEQFMRFARPPALSWKPLDVPTLLREVESLVRPTMDQAGITWELMAAAHPPTSGDAAQLKQVLLNLLENARQAISGPGRVTVRGFAEAAAYAITVTTDTGGGISPEDLPRIFDLYFTRKRQGTGIGLAMASQIVTLHDGTLSVSSRPGAGTTFTTRLPYRPPTEVPCGAPA